jgi:multiple sugar transport system permease protein
VSSAPPSSGKGLFSRTAATIPYRWRMMVPLLLVLGATVAYPLGYSLWLSLRNFEITRRYDVSFVGLEQYAQLVGDESYRVAMLNTFVFVAVAVSLELVIGLALALTLRRQRFVRNLTRSLLLTPMFVTPIAVGLMFRFLLDDQLGVIPSLLGVFGISIDFFGPDLALFSLALIDVWQWTPFMLLLLLAGLESLPQQPFEAARVDGASPWMTFTRVTLPLLRPIIVVAVLIRGLDALKVFEYVFAITQGGPGTATETIQFVIYREGFQFYRLSEAAAMAWTVVIIVMAIVVILFWRFTKAQEQ